MGSLAASGGYYISVPCRWIVANELTITGSIGVIMHGWNYRGLMDKVGIAPMTYKSGKFKDMLSGERSPNEIPPEEHAMMQALIDETYGNSRTSSGLAVRRLTRKTARKARPWPPIGPVSRMAGCCPARRRSNMVLWMNSAILTRRWNGRKKSPRISNANLIEYRERYDISDLFSMFGQSSSAHDIKLDLGVDLPKLRGRAALFPVIFLGELT